MKFSPKTFAAIFCLFAVCLLSGCASTGKWSPFAAVRSVDAETGETNTVWGVNPNLLDWLDTASDVNSAVNPTPSAPIINLALTGISLALAAYARRQNAKAKSAEAKARLVPVLIEGVEASESKEAKESIRTTAMHSGVSDQLHAEVKSITR